MGIAALTCPKLRSQHFTPSVHQLLPLSLPHLDKWQHHSFSCSDQKSKSRVFLSHPEAVHQHILLVFLKITQNLTSARHPRELPWSMPPSSLPEISEVGS